MRAPGITQQLQKHRTMSVLLMERRRSIFATWPPSPLAMLIEARNRMCCQRDTPLNLCQDSFEDIQCYRAAMGKHLDTTHLMSPSVYDGCPPTDAASCGQADTARVRTHARTFPYTRADREPLAKPIENGESRHTRATVSRRHPCAGARQSQSGTGRAGEMTLIESRKKRKGGDELGRTHPVSEAIPL